IPCALAPLRVRGPTASALNRLSCQITRAKNSSGRSFALAADSIIRQIDSRTSGGASFSGVGASGAGLSGAASGAGESVAAGSADAEAQTSDRMSVMVEHQDLRTIAPAGIANASL